MSTSSNGASSTRTGNFPIGFRRGWSEWQKDLSSLLQWSKENNFAAIDLGRNGADEARAVQEAGLRIGTVDLLDWQGMISPDAGKRHEAIAKNAFLNGVMHCRISNMGKFSSEAMVEENQQEAKKPQSVKVLEIQFFGF